MIYSSDYSQIELRVLAHISNDEHLKAAFLEGQDIHASTAMRVFGIEKAEDVTPNMRRQAKSSEILVSCMASLITDFHKILGISRKAAQQYIDTYFEKYPGVKEYMERIVREAKRSRLRRNAVSPPTIFARHQFKKLQYPFFLRNEQLSIHQFKEVLLIF